MTLDLKTNPPPATLFSKDAKDIAELLNKDTSKNKSTQIRRFYDELVGWQERIGTDEQKFKDYEAFIHMLNAKAAYAQGRKLVTQEFVEWLNSCIKQVTDTRTLNHFRLHFEAMLGFLKFFKRD
ncbi:type III-A CRISPR-associated protein Csm2 [Nitrosomonas eutropha]|uniref:CRISPR system Cms protein Csm2 n=2 Tax=Nitrosomonas eutropha TaxID=916 RepID=A0ABX5M7C1_9PROT|nr:type III-A CRISPR-associated protein Csm2 [Nitrosomonas eutropha]ABI60435.1 CRISPR-associated protein, Csm2 family protein [Nitrosomonas eutropha C91]PXV77794.1 CRISPR-associated protein Csm2 [Nitrosomonas eutropha]SEJ26383.1 CRISPR-associated protein Csm2 [Nitrosomonas eutropha]